jgi:hypothetical protein
MQRDICIIERNNRDKDYRERENKDGDKRGRDNIGWQYGRVRAGGIFREVE